MRGATKYAIRQTPPLPISIHAPHAGRDEGGYRGLAIYFTISIHAPHAGRDLTLRGMVKRLQISIHAPHAGRDLVPGGYCAEHQPFQSTRPMRGATTTDSTGSTNPSYFNPRAPCGARPW